MGSKFSEFKFIYCSAMPWQTPKSFFLEKKFKNFIACPSIESFWIFFHEMWMREKSVNSKNLPHIIVVMCLNTFFYSPSPPERERKRERDFFPVATRERMMMKKKVGKNSPPQCTSCDCADAECRKKNKKISEKNLLA